MKKIILSLLLLFAMVAPSCIKRTVIPDEELALIFRDAFLVNAYVLEEKVKFDTMQVYQPIFDRYGYTSEDVAYTVGSFSKRKSARLSDVVEKAIKLLETGDAYYKNEAMILDTIEAKSLRAATKRVYHKELVEFYDLKDTTELVIELENLSVGDYKISFTYFVDSLDNNKSNYRSQSWAVEPGTGKRKGLSTTYLRKNREHDFEKKITFDSVTSLFVIKLAETLEAKRSPHITFNNIQVDFTPEKDIAINEYFKKKLDIRIFTNDFFKLQPTDSLELPSL